MDWNMAAYPHPYLMKKGKKATAAYIQEECSRTGSPRQLTEILDHLLDPRKKVGDREAIEWCRWLMAGGKTPDDFFSTVRLYDNATTCGLVWTANFVAYRCRTCGISPCMSLCASCFQRGNHEGHDFNMFRSQAGGACDCGDTSVMKESGFCHQHGPKVHLEKPRAPQDLLCVAEVLLPRMILRLLQHLRGFCAPDNPSVNVETIQEAEPFFTVLHQFSQLGAAMRHVMTQALINPQIYKDLTDVSLCKDPELKVHLNEINEKYALAFASVKSPELPEEMFDFPAMKNGLVHNTFLDELVFWTVMFEFPQELVCFLLNMLPDNVYKEAFTRAFVRHYSQIALMLVKSSDHDKLSNRVVHVSVQLFSNEALALHMAEDLHLLHAMVISLKSMMRKILIPSTLHDAAKNLHYVVDCNQHVMKNHCYWSLVSDLNNVLSHKPLVMMFLGDSALLEMWFDFLSMFQGMNVNKRQLHQHIKFEPSTYYAAFSAELEASASVMWALVVHLKDENSVHLTKRVLNHCLTVLQDWFDALSFPNTDVADPMQVSFHLPLHRYLAVFLNQAVKYQNQKLEDVLPSTEMLKNLMVHPLKAQVAFYEIVSGLWVRNGLQIKGQAMTYIQCHFCNSMADADFFLLQLCAAHTDPDWFLMTVLERFHVLQWLSFDPKYTQTIEPDHEMSMLEGAITFLASLLSVRTIIGLQDDDLTKLEMVTLLCMGDKTHSQLMDYMPEKCGSVWQNKDFEATLARVADYKAPNFGAGGNMMQGMYVPKTEVWEYDYDPIYVLLRAVHRRDFQASLDRFGQFARQSGKFKGCRNLWPPFRIPGPVYPGYVDPRRLLHCKTMHSLLFTILYKSLHSATVSDMTMALCIYLLDMAVTFPAAERLSGKELLQFSGSSDDEVGDLAYNDWFDGSFILTNLQRVISKVVFSSKHEAEDGDSMEVENYSMYDTRDPSSVVDTPVFESAAEPGALYELGALPAIAPLPLLPPPLTSQALVPVSGSNTMVTQPNLPMALGHSQTYETQSTVPFPALPQSSSQPETSSASMAVVVRAVEVALATTASSSALPKSIGTVSLPQSRSLPTMLSGQSSDEDDILLRALPPLQSNYAEVNESMLSLLLKLHSKLSGKPDSYVPLNERPSSSSCDLESRIGDGPHFIQILLDKICKVSMRNARSIQEIRSCLWPQQHPECSPSSPMDCSDKEERKRKARERQQKLMADFASQQKAFMEQAKDVDNDLVEDETNSKLPESMESSIYGFSKEYDCVICGQTSPSTDAKPVGLVCLLQASSVLGYSNCDSDLLNLPCSEEEKNRLLTRQRRAVFMRNRMEELTRNFDYASSLMSVNIGWEGGVHVRTCGHHLHLDCHKAYIKSLRQNQHNQRQPSFAVEKGEYYCPLCRQLANTVLPVAPDTDEIAAVVKSGPNSQKALASELLNVINSEPPTPEKTNLMKAMSAIMEDITNTTYKQYMFCLPSQYVESLFLFISSVARTNLELDIVQRNGSLCGEPLSSSLRPCLVPLLHVLGMHSKIVPVKPHLQLWPQITGLQLDDSFSSVSRCEKEVPLLLRDITTLLLQLVLRLPMHMDKAYFTCIVQMLYNVVYTQSLATLSCQMSEEQRISWKEAGKREASSMTTLVSVLGEVIDTLEHSALYLQDDDMDRAACLKRWSLVELQDEVKQMCMPFVRIAALLQHHIYHDTVPLLQGGVLEFHYLTKCLGLAQGGEKSSEEQCLPPTCLTWVVDYPRIVIQTWCQDFMAFVNVAQISARNLLEQHETWHQPKLLGLPQSYDVIFQHYHQKPCQKCRGIPKEPSICLVCGTVVCLRESCCRRQAVGEAVQHSIDCGAGTAMFLGVNSSTIIVIRGKRASIWGSVYLDSYGEEDHNLKRGKPLYLSQERYQLLEQQWITHGFDHANKRWVWHKEIL